MTRLEKCKLFESKGFTYNPETGDITSHRGKIITTKNDEGYINLQSYIGLKKINLLGHHFAYWMHYRIIPEYPLVMDHNDRNESNNRINNLNITTQSKNVINRGWIENCKGCGFEKSTGKWKTSIQLDKKRKYLGRFSTEKEARQAYLNALQYYYPDRYNELKNKNLI